MMGVNLGEQAHKLHGAHPTTSAQLQWLNRLCDLGTTYSQQ